VLIIIYYNILNC